MPDFDAWRARYPEAAQALAALVQPVTLAPSEGSESRVQAELRLESVKHGALWRNNAGGYQDETGRHVRYGLGNDSKKFWEKWRSGDLCGITRVTVQPHHVGRTWGVFTMIEVKEPGWNPKVLDRPSNTRERAQMNCLTHVASLGGIAGFATSTDDYRRYITDFIT